MKVALVHELLTMKGGAERVLKMLADAFPDAPIYTLLYDEKKLGGWFPKERVRTSSLQKFASLISFNHHLYLPFFPRAVEKWNFDEFDVVISSSSAFVHGLKTSAKTKHISYIHSPARYLWDRTHDVLANTDFSNRGNASWIFHRLRLWDASVADRPNVLLAASKAVQRRIELYWRRKSTVLHPPIDDVWFETTNDEPRENFFLIVSTLARYKRIELAIEACNRGKIHLKIVGEGPERARLQKLAGPTIEFLGYAKTSIVKSLYKKTRAVIIPGEEDFGLVPVEALSQGCPVIAYGKGGVTETITPGITGEFFGEPTADSLLEVMQKYDHKKYSPETLKQAAQLYKREAFLTSLRKHLSL